MEMYLAIITTVLVLTQIIRLIQNVIQLRRQKVLFEKQLGQLDEITQEDLEIQRKAYRMMVEYFQEKKMKPPIIREERKSVATIYATSEIGKHIHPQVAENELKEKLGKAVYQYAQITHRENPIDMSVRFKARLDVLDGGTEHG